MATVIRIGFLALLIFALAACAPARHVIKAKENCSLTACLWDDVRQECDCAARPKKEPTNHWIDWLIQTTIDLAIQDQRLRR